MRNESLVLILLFVLLQCNIGHALLCYSCTGDCTNVTTIQCGADEQCLTQQQKAGGTVQSQQKGCLKSQECSATSSDPSMSQQCCNTDFCNADTSTTASTSTTTSASTTASTSTVTTESIVNKDKDPSTGLVCHFCDSFFCLQKSAVTCKPDEVCVTTSATIIFIPQKKFGCANTTICSKNTTEVVLEQTIMVENKCCNTNLCNLAVTLKLPSIAAIGAVLLMWITKLS